MDLGCEETAAGTRVRDVRPEDADALARVLVTAVNAAFRGIVPDHCLALTEEESRSGWTHTLKHGPPAGDALVVAEAAGGEIVGYAWAGLRANDARFRGELRQLNVLPEYQRSGIGRMLMCQVASWLLAQGISTLRAEVLRDSPNRAFYERMGGAYVDQYPYDWDGVEMPMYVYGWGDTRGIMAGEPPPEKSRV